MMHFLPNVSNKSEGEQKQTQIEAKKVEEAALQAEKDRQKLTDDEKHFIKFVLDGMSLKIHNSEF